MIIFSLEGNIGCGKEQFIEFFKKYFTNELLFLDDSFYNWDNEELLKNFYSDPERWSLSLEIHSTLLKYNSLKNRVDENIIITRRSPISDRECFVKACKDMKYINDKEYSIYNNFFETLTIPKIQGIIYLRSDVNSCYENIISRGTKYEKNISFDFIQKLHNRYTEWIENLKKERIPILEIDIENFRDIEGNEQSQEKLVKLITEKFYKIKECLKTYKYSNKNLDWTVVKRKSKKRNAF